MKPIKELFGGGDRELAESKEFRPTPVAVVAAGIQGLLRELKTNGTNFRREAVLGLVIASLMLSSCQPVAARGEGISTATRSVPTESSPAVTTEVITEIAAPAAAPAPVSSAPVDVPALTGTPWTPEFCGTGWEAMIGSQSSTVPLITKEKSEPFLGDAFASAQLAVFRAAGQLRVDGIDRIAIPQLAQDWRGELAAQGQQVEVYANQDTPPAPGYIAIKLAGFQEGGYAVYLQGGDGLLRVLVPHGAATWGEWDALAWGDDLDSYIVSGQGMFPGLALEIAKVDGCQPVIALVDKDGIIRKVLNPAVKPGDKPTDLWLGSAEITPEPSLAPTETATATPIPFEKMTDQQKLDSAPNMDGYTKSFSPNPYHLTAIIYRDINRKAQKAYDIAVRKEIPLTEAGVINIDLTDGTKWEMLAFIPNILEGATPEEIEAAQIKALEEMVNFIVKDGVAWGNIGPSANLADHMTQAELDFNKRAIKIPNTKTIVGYAVPVDIKVTKQNLFDLTIASFFQGEQKDVSLVLYMLDEGGRGIVFVGMPPDKINELFWDNKIVFPPRPQP